MRDSLETTQDSSEARLLPLHPAILQTSQPSQAQATAPNTSQQAQTSH